MQVGDIVRLRHPERWSDIGGRMGTIIEVDPGNQRAVIRWDRKDGQSRLPFDEIEEVFRE